MSCIDDEWSQFLTSQTAPGFGFMTTNQQPAPQTKSKLVISNTVVNAASACDPSLQDPICEDLYISTKTKVLFLNQAIDINGVFWKIPVNEYWRPIDGVVKKQMKIVSKSKEEFEEYKAKLENVPYYTENIIKQIDNPAARRIKFKDERKITIGISKKDIMNCRGKVKNAFYNCFAIILRFKYEGAFREIHVKVFNTGKLEIPGILNTKLLDVVKGMILDLLRPNINSLVEFIDTNSEDNVLINSNFNCGYFINREKLHSILRGNKYRIETAYDPCSYPGVKCKFYFCNAIGFDEEKQRGVILQEDCHLTVEELIVSKKYTKVSFMIFRTGGCLIVGNCSEEILRFVYEFVKMILKAEYQSIFMNGESSLVKGEDDEKESKQRKRKITVSSTYFSELKKLKD
jgi:hypothetical protein